jgi:hypothetical protein
MPLDIEKGPNEILSEKNVFRGILSFRGRRFSESFLTLKDHYAKHHIG